MVKLIIFSSLFFCSVSLFSQGNRADKSFNILVGIKYTPIDYIGGGILGCSYRISKISLRIRNDISMSIAKADSLSYFGVTEYRVHNYFDILYNLNDKLNASIGYGWVSNKNQIHRLNSEFGYTVISLGINYLISQKIFFELKGDIPLVKWNSPYDQNIAFPVSMGLIYSIK